MATLLDVHQHIGPIAVTLAYLALYYAFQVNLIFVKKRLHAAYRARGEKFDRYFGQDREMLAADRLQLNTLEHMGPFLVLLWMNAGFVGGVGTTVAGAVYVVARTYYPLVIGRRIGRGIGWSVLVSTGVGYAVLGYFMMQLIRAMLA